MEESILCAGTRSSARAEESGSFRSLDKRRKYSEEDPGDDPSPANGADLNRGSNNVSDVADAIEDLLAQSNKVVLYILCYYCSIIFF